MANIVFRTFVDSIETRFQQNYKGRGPSWQCACNCGYKTPWYPSESDAFNAGNVHRGLCSRRTTARAINSCGFVIETSSLAAGGRYGWKFIVDDARITYQATGRAPRAT